jgi:subtilisin family serine protease
MKKLLLSLIVTIVLMAMGLSLPLISAVDPFRGADTKGSTDAYTLRIKANNSVPGILTTDKIIQVNRPDKKYYLQNVILIKTKDLTNISQDGKGLLSSNLMSVIGDVGIKSVEAPFRQYSNSELLGSDKFGVGRIIQIKYNSPVDPFDLCVKLMDNPELEYAEPVFVRYTSAYTPNDPRLSQEWHINNTKVKEAWDVTKGDPTVLIAIVDTGVDWTHDDLKDNIWTNPGEIPSDGIDNDANGKKDDYHGWDFVGNITPNEAAYGQYKEDNDPINNGQFHGTHVAGCASAVTDNAVGVAAPGFYCKIIPIKCASDNAQTGGVHRGYEAILYAAQLGAHVINCSWGGPGYSQAEQDIINQALALGSVVVTASGNDGQNIDNGTQFPAGLDNLMSVGSSETNDKYSTWGNYGVKVTTYAPGASILSTMPGNTYSFQQGTSMACPVASGIVGLVRSVFKNYTPMQIIQQVRSTSDNVLTTDPAAMPYFYGRINAYKAVTFNSDKYPADKVPGVALSSVDITGGGAIRNLEPTDIKLKLTNYLSETSNLVVKIRSLDKYLSISQAQVDIGKLGNLETKDVSIQVQLSEMNPWFSGNANLMLTIEDGAYINYQLINVPVSITTSNKYATLLSIPYYYYISWHGIKAPSANLLWGVGNSLQSSVAGFFMKFDGQTTINKISTYPVFCLYPFDNNTAFAGTNPETGGTASILKTTDGGANWTTKDVSNITSFLNDIHFYTSDEGFIFGDPLAGMTGSANWGVAKTTDAGQTWTRIKTFPAPQSGETAYVGGYEFKGDNIWFGTSKGRLYRSADRGATWQVSTVFAGGHVVHTAFSDALNGLCVYADAADLSTANRFLASTTDGGATWSMNVFDFSYNLLSPSYMYHIPETSQILMLCWGGEVLSTSDNGASFFMELSKQTNPVHTGWGVLAENKVRLWEAGTDVSYLDIPYKAEQVKRIESINGDIVDFGTVGTGKDKTIDVVVANTGNAVLSISSVSIINESGTEEETFTNSGAYPIQLEVNAQAKIPVKFTPKSDGSKQAELVVKSDADAGDLKIDLVGAGSTVGVPELNNIPGFELQIIYPNPVADKLNFDIKSDEPRNISVNIYGLTGKDFGTRLIRSVVAGQSRLTVNISDLPSGAYNIIFNVDGKTISRMVIK